MIVSHDTHEVTLSNVSSTGEFKIRNSARAFSILSSGLYSNKIKAIIRELSCNALDSHIASGNTDATFEVHLPSVLEPWFSVRDFGTGLDGDQVTNIYTTYFESTKTGSNDFIGALGLGSKSPFSYTENFTVTAIKSGIKRIYSAFINELGVPSIAQMSEELSDDPTGVEVKFSVTDRYDYNSFCHEASEVFKWFKHKPKVSGNSGYTCKDIVYKESNIVPGVHYLGSSTYYSVAVMGNIAYPIKISEPTKHFGDLSKLLECDLVMEFGIGELDFAASREELSYVPITIASIKTKLELLNANLISHFSAKADAIENEWERAEFLYKESANKLYSAAVKQYVTNTKFPLYDTTTYYGKYSFRFPMKSLTELNVVGFSVNNGYIRKISKSHEYVNGAYEEQLCIPVDMSVVIVINDLKTGCESRARYHFSNNYNCKSATVYCLSHTNPDMAVREIAYKAVTDKLYNPPLIIKASELSKPIPKKRDPLTNDGIAEFVPKMLYSATSYKWQPATEQLSDTKIYYYVFLNNYTPEDEKGVYFNVDNLRANMDACGIADIASIKLYGVRKSRIKEIKERSNWVWIGDKIKEEVAKVTDNHVKSLVSSIVLDHYRTNRFTDSAVLAKISPTSDYSIFAAECKKIKRVVGDIESLVSLCMQYGKSLQASKVKQELTDMLELVAAKYPLIDHLHSSATSDQIATYITMVDAQ